MSIVRSKHPENHFSVFANEVIRDNRLSFKARGILLELLSRPEGWKVSADALARSGKDGRDSVLAGLSELRAIGYIVTYKRQNEKGQFETLSVVYDSPKGPESGKPESGKPESEKPTSKEETTMKKQVLGTPEGVAQLVALYIDNYKGGGKPNAGLIGKNLKKFLDSKIFTYQELEQAIPFVALDGRTPSDGTIRFSLNAKPKEVEFKPTYTPPQFRAEDLPQGVKPPKDIRVLAGFQNEA